MNEWPRSWDDAPPVDKLDWVEPPAQAWQDAHGWKNGKPPPPPEMTLSAKAWVYHDPTKMQPREWLVGLTLMRGYATVLGSMGGAGKTTFAVALALAYITGRRDILGLHVFQTGNVWLLTLEDDREELERRVAAAMIAHGIRPDEVKGRLFINTARERPVLLARADETGTFMVCDDAEAVEEEIRTKSIGLTIIDPLVKSHALIENNNAHMDQLEALANNIAGRTKTAILLACHFRKGGGEDGARDAIRGGGALVDAARIARTLMPMTAAEAEAFKISPDDAFRFVRVNDAKANLAPRERALWFELVSVDLGNRAVHAAYPSGDSVQAAKAWQPPLPFDGLDLPVIERIFARLRAGPEPEWFYSLNRKAKFWAGVVIVEAAGKTKTQAGAILTKWAENGVLSEERYLTPTRNDATRIVLDEAKVSAMLDPLRAFQGDEA